MNGEKTCCVCKQTKPLAEFHRARRAKDGRQTACKPCMRLSVTARRQKELRVKKGEAVYNGAVHRLCRKCDVFRPLEDFPQDPRPGVHRGRMWTCTPCRAQTAPAGRDPEPPTLKVYRQRCAEDEATNEAAFDALAANTAAALGR